MDHLTPSFHALLVPFAPCFRAEVFVTFELMTAAWVVCLGRRTISRLWETTGHARSRDHSAAFRLFNQAVWNWDELRRILLVCLLTALVPGTTIWLVLDDTLCHKRGAKVAFGGIFLDAVLSTKKPKTLRFGLNWVVLGVAVPLPLRDDRYFCLPVLWRCYRKKGQAGYRSRTQLAARMAHHLAEALPDRAFWLVGDSAYINSELIQGRPANLQVLGPLRWDAALYEVPGPYPGQGRPAKKGDRLPTPLAMIEDTTTYPASEEVIEFPKLERRLRIQVVRGVLWYTGCGEDPVTVVLVRDPLGQWRDEALVATDPTASAAFVIQGYCRRWSIETCQADSTSSDMWCESPDAGYDRRHRAAWTGRVVSSP